MEVLWILFIVAAASLCAVLLGKNETEKIKQNTLEELSDKAIRFSEECYIEGIVPIQKVKRLAEFYLVQESQYGINQQEAGQRIAQTLGRYGKKQED